MLKNSPSPLCPDQEAPNDWSKKRSKRENQLYVALIFRPLQKWYEIRQYDQIHTQYASTADTLDRSTGKHSGYRGGSGADDTSNREDSHRSKEHGLAAKDICQRCHGWLTHCACEQIASGYPKGLYRGGIERLSDRLMVLSASCSLLLLQLALTGRVAVSIVMSMEMMNCQTSLAASHIRGVAFIVRRRRFEQQEPFSRFCPASTPCNRYQDPVMYPLHFAFRSSRVQLRFVGTSGVP